jgi:2-phospho-L-lactate guanylyltransferase
VLRDQGPGSLADVVDRALAEVSSLGAKTAVVLMADLPRIEPGDVGALLAALEGHDVALVRDHLGRHTNALALSPPTAMATCFGREDSFAAHCAAARAAGLRAVTVESERIAFDVDLPADHQQLTARQPAVGT